MFRTSDDILMQNSVGNILPNAYLDNWGNFLITVAGGDMSLKNIHIRVRVLSLFFLMIIPTGLYRQTLPWLGETP